MSATNSNVLFAFLCTATLLIAGVGCEQVAETRDTTPPSRPRVGEAPNLSATDSAEDTAAKQDSKKDEGKPIGHAPRRIEPNRLADETSPYLLMHAHNPVDWYPWGAEAFEKARKENKLIFLSIGYSSCHWCHVMERESFMDDEIAKFLNEHFVSIKVDREERPDVDDIYMTAVQLVTQHGGWPLTAFLTPDAKPFFGGTYFPARTGDRGARVGFLDLIKQVKQIWETKA